MEHKQSKNFGKMFSYRCSDWHLQQLTALARLQMMDRSEYIRTLVEHEYDLVGTDDDLS